MDLAACSDTARVLGRVGSILERFSDADQAAPARAYVSGTVPSELLPLPEAGVGIESVLDELAIAVEHGCRIGSPGFLGYITTTATTVGVAVQAAVAAAGGQRYLLHSFNALEWTALRWLAELCGLPKTAAGVFTSGGSSANLVALGAARQAAYERLGIDVAETGVPDGAPRGRFYASERAHRTVHRSAAILGLGTRRRSGDPLRLGRSYRGRCVGRPVGPAAPACRSAHRPPYPGADLRHRPRCRDACPLS